MRNAIGNVLVALYGVWLLLAHRHTGLVKCPAGCGLWVSPASIDPTCDRCTG